MSDTISKLNALGLGVPDILIPRPGTDLKKWAVVACDQYTSEKEYWQSVDAFVGSAPSTLRLVFPEAYLDDPDTETRIRNINRKMTEYVESDLFATYPESFFLVHRETGPSSGRWGLVVCLDLDCYDFSKSSRTLIRATEGTILSRIPPRKRIRKDAPLELPHILVLINDAKHTVIEPLVAMKDSLEPVYHTDLMKNGGKISAYRVHGEKLLGQVALAFKTLHAALDPANPLLFAMGDGNHSLATAKSCWEDIKSSLDEEERLHHPARYAMVELENIFDPGLEFEPIHRVLFNIDASTFFSQLSRFCEKYDEKPASSLEQLVKTIEKRDGKQRFGYADADGLRIVTVDTPCATIPAGTLQSVIDSLLENHGKGHVDYIHGIDVTMNLGSKPGNIGLFLPVIDKNTFFDTIVKDGALPRKTFSMGEAHEKRYYMEARKIR